MEREWAPRDIHPEPSFRLFLPSSACDRTKFGGRAAPPFAFPLWASSRSRHPLRRLTKPPSALRPALCYQHAQAHTLAAVDHLEGNGPASTKRPCSSQSVSDRHQPVELPPPPSFAPPSPVRGDHLPTSFEPRLDIPLDSISELDSALRPGLEPDLGSHLPHANLVCRRDTSSCVFRFSIQQVPAQLESTATNRPARGCCCAVLCAVPQSARGASTSRGRPREDPSSRGVQGVRRIKHRQAGGCSNTSIIGSTRPTDEPPGDRPNSKLHAQHFFVDPATLSTAILLQSLPLDTSPCDQRPSSTPRPHNSAFACDTA